MRTIVHLHAFARAAKEAGITEAELEAPEALLSTNPMAGDEIPGTGGCRKLRLAGRGKGKSGGYRVVSFYTGIEFAGVPADGILER